MVDEVVIERRFRGPPGSGNGGYTCGLAAAALPDAEVVEVTLRSPPPLERALTLARVGAGRAELRDGDGPDATLVAEAQRADAELPAPEPPSEQAAAGAAIVMPEHPFPECFACGPDRSADDGLCLFPGPLHDHGVIACTWTPDASTSQDGRSVRPEIVWAALDCPTGWATGRAWGDLPQPPEWESEQTHAMVLGRLTARLIADVPVERPAVVTAWRTSGRGRRREAGAAVHAPGGEALAVGHGVWIELRDPGAFEAR